MVKRKVERIITFGDTWKSIAISTSRSMNEVSLKLFATPWTVALQAPLSMGFSRQEHWSGLPFLPPGDLPNPGIKPRSPALQANSLPSEPPRKPRLEHSPPQWFTFCPWLFLSYKAELSPSDRDPYGLQSRKYLLPGPLPKTFSDRSSNMLKTSLVWK